MIIKVTGNTAFGFREFSNVGELAHTLAPVSIGGSIDIDGFIDVTGEEKDVPYIRMAINNVQRKSGMKFTTKMEDGVLRVWRVK